MTGKVDTMEGEDMAAIKLLINRDKECHYLFQSRRNSLRFLTKFRKKNNKNFHQLVHF